MANTPERPVIDYSSKDFAGYRRLLLDAKRELLPEWTSESPNDFGVVLIELFAYVGDVLSFYGDRIAGEAFLSTAINRASVVNHARMLDYRPNGRAAASVDVEVVSNAAVTVPEGTRFSTRMALGESDEAPVFFESTEDVEVDGAALIPLREGVTVVEVVGESTGGIDQSFVLDQFPVVDLSVRVQVDEGQGWTEWTYLDRLLEADSSRSAFTTAENNAGVITVMLGDGANGRVPPQGAAIRAIYRVGAGERGNVGAGTIKDIHAEDSAVTSAVFSVNNPAPATGGADQESADSIRRNAPRALASQQRAVTLEDYADIVLRVPGVAKARAKQVAYSTVAVYVAPTGSGTAATTEKKAEVADLLETAKMSNIDVFVEDPVFAPIDITVDVVVEAAFQRGQVEVAVERAVLELLDFDAVDFAELLPVSRVYEAVSAVVGVDYADVTVLDRDGGGGKQNVQLEELEIPVVGEVTVNATGGILGT